MAYLDIAFGNPVPNSVKEVMFDYLERIQVNGVAVERAKAYEVLGYLKSEFGSFVNAKPRELALVKNTSEGLNIAANGIHFEKGDNVVLNELEHLNNTYCWLRLKQKDVEIRVAPSTDGRVSIESLDSMIDENTKAVAIASITNLGLRFNITEVSKLCRENNSILVVDAVQSLGIEPIEVRKLGIDILSTSAHKGLLGPHGIGFFYCSDKLLDEIEPVYVARTSFSSIDYPKTSELKDSCEKFQFGNYNYIGIYGLIRGIQLLKDVGIDNICRHSWNLARVFRDGLNDIGVINLNSSNIDERAHIVTFKVPSMIDQDVRAKLESMNIRVSSHYGDLRASFAG